MGAILKRYEWDWIRMNEIPLGVRKTLCGSFFFPFLMFVNRKWRMYIYIPRNIHLLHELFFIKKTTYIRYYVCVYKSDLMTTGFTIGTMPLLLANNTHWALNSTTFIPRNPVTRTLHAIKKSVILNNHMIRLLISR